MHPESARPGRSPTPAVAAGLALALLASSALPALAAAVVVAAVPAACATVLARRGGRRLRLALLLLGCWLAVALAGAWLLRAAPGGGLAWVLGALFLAPLPLVPWVYAATFEDRP